MVLFEPLFEETYPMAPIFDEDNEESKVKKINALQMEGSAAIALWLIYLADDRNICKSRITNYSEQIVK